LGLAAKAAISPDSPAALIWRNNRGNNRRRYSQALFILKSALDKTEALIIGAGAGLSSAAGLDCDNADTFNAMLPGYHDRYDIKTINEAGFYQFPTPEEQYDYWAKLISAARYNFPLEDPALIYAAYSRTKTTPSYPQYRWIVF
jgi:hypothetical protein